MWFVSFLLWEFGPLRDTEMFGDCLDDYDEFQNADIQFECASCGTFVGQPEISETFHNSVVCLGCADVFASDMEMRN